MLRGQAQQAAQLVRCLLEACSSQLQRTGCQESSRLPPLAAPLLQQQRHSSSSSSSLVTQVYRVASQSVQGRWQQLSGVARLHTQQLMQLQQQQLQQPLLSRLPATLISGCGMATRVEQQQAANPGLRYWKPTSPGQRGRVTIRRSGIWKGRPLRSLTQGATRIGGRNCHGRITVRHRGGGHKRRLRMVDFGRHSSTAGLVERLEYDPNRTGYIALVRYPAAPSVTSSGNVQQPIYAYLLAPQDLNPGDTVQSGANAPIKPGNTMPLKDIPVGMPINSIELHPNKGGQLCRAAGCMATIVNKQQEHAIVRLPSGEQRLINLKCRATIGAVSNPQNKNRVLGKAGASRNLGRRPSVRGVAMNPVDHPMGGGTAGGRPSCSPWGLHAKGKKTRDKHKASNRWILARRTKRSAK